MAKMIFRYGAMGAAKSANALMTVFNYEEQGYKVLLLKPSLDTRWDTNKIISRAGGMSRECVCVSKNESISPLVAGMGYKTVIVDEAQFLTEEQVKELAFLTDREDLTTICYGLKNSAIVGELFEGSKALLYWADAIEELKTLCTCCGKKATQNLRLKNGLPVYKGETICLGDTKESENTEYYAPVCRKHYFEPDLISIKKKYLKKQEKTDL